MSIRRKPKLIVIAGPTASGKSALAVFLAKKFGGEIVSADSMQVYKEMDIGTDKIKSEKRKAKSEKNAGGENFILSEGVSHYMIDIVRPDEKFTLAQYKRKAVKIIKDIQARGKIPFLVGGTGLYISAIVDNLKIPRAKPDEKLREKLSSETGEKLMKRLEKLDPIAAGNIDPANKRRVVRALEVCLATGKPFSAQQAKGRPMFDILQIGVSRTREKLYEKIDRRVDEMAKEGLPEEVESLSKKYSWDLPSMGGLGYKQMGMHLRGEIDLPEAIRLLKRDTRHYAKRQITWLKRDKGIKWIKGRREAEKIVRSFVSK